MIDPTHVRGLVGQWLICHTPQRQYQGQLLRVTTKHMVMNCPSGRCISYSKEGAEDDIALAYSPYGYGYGGYGYGGYGYGGYPPYGYGAGARSFLIPLASVVGLTLIGLRW